MKIMTGPGGAVHALIVLYLVPGRISMTIEKQQQHRKKGNLLLLVYDVNIFLRLRLHLSVEKALMILKVQLDLYVENEIRGLFPKRFASSNLRLGQMSWGATEYAFYCEAPGAVRHSRHVF